MVQVWRQRSPTILSSVILLAVALSVSWPAHAKTITAVMHSDLRVIDPGFTPAYITRDHGYMVYDTLLATDANFRIQPQMADWKVSDDGLTYTFTLRDGLEWHDGTPVTAEDCVTSLKRWGKNDSMGQKLMDFTASLEATDAKTITLKLKERYGLVLESMIFPAWGAVTFAGCNNATICGLPVTSPKRTSESAALPLTIREGSSNIFSSAR